MAFPDNAVPYLIAWTEAFEQHYRGGVADFMRRHGKTTRIIPMRKQRVLGDSIEYTVKAMHNRSTRVVMDPLAAMPDPQPGEYVTFTVTFDYNDPANNDFASFEVGFRTSIYDLWKRSDRTFKDSPDFIRKDVQEGLDDVKETFAKFLHLPASGLIANIAAAANRDDDSDLFAAAGAYSAGRTTMLIQLNNTAIARIGDGQLLDIYDAAGETEADRVIGPVRVTYVNPFEQTIAIQILQGTTTNGGATATPGAAANLDLLDTAITNGATRIFLSGSAGNAPAGTLDALFDIATTPIYYGRRRVDTAAGGDAAYDPRHRILIPVRVDASGGGATVNLTADLFRRIGEVVGWMGGSHAGTANLAMIMSRFEYRQIAAFTRDEGITITPALESEVGKKLNKAFGFDGFILHDPNLGSQMMIVDDFAEPGQITFLNRSQWEQATPIDGGFRMFPGELAGIWTRNMHTDTGTIGTPSKIYSANGIQLAAFVCTYPKGQTRLEGLTVA